MSELGPCEEWTGHRGTHGYGVLMHQSRQVLAHRHAWEQANGPIPPGLYVCHHCDNRLCVRPSHLFVGTQTENMQDAKRKGRIRWPGVRGSQVGTSKLTEAQVAEIKALIRQGHRLQSIADQYHVHVKTISLINRRKSWTHVEAAA